MNQYQLIWWTVFSSVFGFLVFLCISLILFQCWVLEEHFSMAAKLRKAIKSGELNMNYQPIVNMRTGEWTGMEALIRWSTSGNIISPAVFIPLAERMGSIGELTRWIVKRVAEDYASYFWYIKGLYITINLSAQDVEDDTFVDFVHELFSRYSIPARRIVFEVSEGVLMNRSKGAIQLQRFREQGYRVAIDDFGTGYSSLAYIEDLPIDILKIDRAFLGAEKINSPDAIWRHVVTMANSLKLTVVAEGVETPEQVEALIDRDVELAQGWLFAKALPPAIFAKQFYCHHLSTVDDQSCGTARKKD
jgi:sensor c-di-GMP phosphodiesterase-like protein